MILRAGQRGKKGLRNAGKRAFRPAIDAAAGGVHAIVEIGSAVFDRAHNAPGSRGGRETCRAPVVVKRPGPSYVILHMTDVFRRGAVASRTDRCILAVDIVSCLKQLAGNIEILIEYR